MAACAAITPPSLRCGSACGAPCGSPHAATRASQPALRHRGACAGGGPVPAHPRAPGPPPRPLPGLQLSGGGRVPRRPAPPEPRIGRVGGVSWEVLVAPHVGRSAVSAVAGRQSPRLFMLGEHYVVPHSGHKDNAPGGINRFSMMRLSPRLLVLGAPRALPHAGHRTRLQAPNNCSAGIRHLQASPILADAG